MLLILNNNILNNNILINYYLKARNYYTFRLMDSLPDDMLRHIFYCLHKNDYYSFKSATHRFNTLISATNIAKVMLLNKLHNYSPIAKCVNAYCYRDTKDLFYNIYMRHNTLYRHSHQHAINKKTIIHKRLNYEVISPYCYICFMTHILKEDFPKYVLRIG